MRINLKNRKFLITIFLVTLFLSMVFISGCKKNISGSSPSTAISEGVVNTTPEGEDNNIKNSDISITNTTKNSSESTSSSANSTKFSDLEEAGGESKTYANDFSLLDYDNEKVSLSDFQGKLVVLNFFGTWCVPCKSEIPDFVAVYETYKDNNVQFVGISQGSDSETVKSFAIEYKINYPVLIDGTTENVASKWGITGIPTTFLLGTNGEVLGGNIGPLTEDQLIKAIEGAK